MYQAQKEHGDRQLCFAGNARAARKVLWHILQTFPTQRILVTPRRNCIKESSSFFAWLLTLTTLSDLFLLM